MFFRPRFMPQVLRVPLCVTSFSGVSGHHVPLSRPVWQRRQPLCWHAERRGYSIASSRLLPNSHLPSHSTQHNRGVHLQSALFQDARALRPAMSAQAQMTACMTAVLAATAAAHHMRAWPAGTALQTRQGAGCMAAACTSCSWAPARCMCGGSSQRMCAAALKHCPCMQDAATHEHLRQDAAHALHAGMHAQL